MTPWTDRSGRFSPLKAGVLTLLFLPALWIAWQFWFGEFNPRPFTAANHTAGDWTIRLLVLTLALSPLRRITGWNRLVTVRRLMGVATCCYGLLHAVLYVGDLGWNLGKAASEITSRFYLMVGAAALFGLVLLAATSTDAAVRALKRNWGRLHALVHPIAILGLWHFFLQSRFDVFEPILLAGLYAALIALRLFARLGHGDGPLAIVAAALAAALVTLGVEIAWYGLNNGIAATRVLRADFSLASGLRPLWWVVIGALSPLVVSRWLRSIGLPLFSGVKSG